MNILSVTRISKNNRDGILLDDITFGLEYGEKAALIGRNGCGKSTLLSIISGRHTPDDGKVSINNTTGISYLAQAPVFNPEQTIREYIFANGSVRTVLINEYETICEQLAHSPDQKTQSKFEELALRMDKENAWNYEQEIKSILNVLGISELNLKMSALSGGMLKKVELAQVLIEDNDLLLLDEPTNHLDMETISWLEEFLIKTRKTVLMVTHDRYFLDSICTAIYEIERGKIKLFKGNFSYYLEKKAEEQFVTERTESKIESHLRTEMEWLRRGPKARGTKAKARKDAIHKLINRDKIQEADDFAFDINGRRLGGKILEADSIEKKYDSKVVIKPFSYSFKKGERLGLFGNNGSGKTTLLNMLTGRLQPDSGKVIKGDNTVIGYYTQHTTIDDLEQTVISYIRETAEVIKLSDGTELSASKLLERFGFDGKMQYSSLKTLSGGERKRVYLVKLLLSNPNFLILDEPTNDFDIYTLSVLEDFLSNYPGCIVLVSHDRYFIDKIASMLLVINSDGEISGFAGGATEYIELKKELNAETEQQAKQEIPKNKVNAQAPAETKDKKKLSFKEARELEMIEKEIESIESRKNELEAMLSSGESDHIKLKTWSDEFDQITKELSIKYERWEYLASV